jgi:AraC family transcriptional regulator, regulatory protein of adaptative response / methylated-DNA-[protein]-cysteine methyltransferase
MMNTTAANTDYARIERAIGYLHEHQDDQPALDEVASHVGLSPFHFQRMFVSWAGVTPKEFLQALTLQRAKQLLQQSNSLLDTSLQAGLSGPSRLHDLFLQVEKMTPGEYKAAAKGLTIYWSIGETPFGPALFAATDRGLCRVAFADDAVTALAELEAQWPSSSLVESARHVAPYAEEVVRRMRGLTPKSRLGLLLKGSDLRLKVWLALLRVPPGNLVSYSHLAQAIEQPGAVRAVASSVAENPIAFLVPCHRVIRSTGAHGEYHWGADRKLALIGVEQARAAA